MSFRASARRVYLVCRRLSIAFVDAITDDEDDGITCLGWNENIKSLCARHAQCVSVSLFVCVSSVPHTPIKQIICQNTFCCFSFSRLSLPLPSPVLWLSIAIRLFLVAIIFYKTNWEWQPEIILRQVEPSWTLDPTDTVQYIFHFPFVECMLIIIYIYATDKFHIVMHRESRAHSTIFVSETERRGV